MDVVVAAVVVDYEVGYSSAVGSGSCHMLAISKILLSNHLMARHSRGEPEASGHS